jgi:hypothetical protein
MSYRQSLFFTLCSLLTAILPTALCFGQVASRTDGGTVIYYDSIYEAVEAAAGASIDRPDESTLQIASVMKLAYTTADFHAKNLYKKLNVQGRTELLVKMRG